MTVWTKIKYMIGFFPWFQRCIDVVAKVYWVISTSSIIYALLFGILCSLLVMLTGVIGLTPIMIPLIGTCCFLLLLFIGFMIRMEEYKLQLRKANNKLEEARLYVDWLHAHGSDSGGDDNDLDGDGRSHDDLRRIGIIR